MAAKLTTRERNRIVKLLESGKSCNAIAKEVRRSPTTISSIAKEEGHTFGQSNTQNAQARKAYCAEAREAVKQRLWEEAQRMLDELNAKTLVFSFGGKDNDFNQRTLDKPDAKTKRDLVVSIGIAIDKAEMIEKNSNVDDSGRGAMLALLDAMGVQTSKPTETVDA